jgi:general secretion pathway protein G
MLFTAHTATEIKRILPHQGNLGHFPERAGVPALFPRFCRVIRLQDHSMFRQEAARVCEQFKFWRFRPRLGMYPLLQGQVTAWGFAWFDAGRRSGVTMGAGAVKARGCTALTGISAPDDRSGRSLGPLRRAGFTLVELLIAVAIVGVLAAIAVPSYQNYRDRVMVAQAVIDITSLGAAIALYRLDSHAFPNSLADIGQAGRLDPWNHPYVYLNLSPLAHGLNGKVRKDKNLHPLNSDFDLCSMGKDGKTAAPLTAAASRDDILRANDGRFVGLASDY